MAEVGLHAKVWLIGKTIPMGRALGRRDKMELQDGHPPASRTSQASGTAWDPYLQDGAPLRLALHVLAGLEHAQGDAVQKDDQHADVLKPGERKVLRRAHTSSGHREGGS